MSSSLLPAEKPEKQLYFSLAPVIMTNIGKENKMGKLQTFLASAIIGLSPAGGGNLNAQTTEPQWPKTEKTEKTDVFARFRMAEKHALPLLVFSKAVRSKLITTATTLPPSASATLRFPTDAGLPSKTG